MKLSELTSLLLSHPEKSPSFVLPDGDIIPAHFHVTEVGHVVKNFIDCGGTTRRTESVQLQIWLGADAEHRLTAGKLAGILTLGKSVIPNDELAVEVEYEDCSISQYPVFATEVSGDQVIVRLEEKHTDCLAKEACGVEAIPSGAGCCGSEGKCCG